KKPYAQMQQGEKTMLRYNYLMSVTKDAQGDFIRTAGELANGTRTLTARWSQLRGTLGEFLTTVLTPAVGMLNKMVQWLQDGVDGWNMLFASMAKPKIISQEEADKEEKKYNAQAAAAIAAAQAKVDADRKIIASAKKKSQSLAGFDVINTLSKGAAGGATVDTSTLKADLKALVKAKADAKIPFKLPDNTKVAGKAGSSNKGSGGGGGSAWGDETPKLTWWQNLKKDWKDFWGKAGKWISQAFTDTKKSIATWWNENVAVWFTAEKWQKLGKSITTAFSNTKKSIAIWWNENVAVWFTAEKWQKLGGKILNAFDITKGSIAIWFHDYVAVWFTTKKWQELGASIGTGIKSGFSSVVGFFVNSINGIIGMFETAVGGIVKAINVIIMAYNLAGKALGLKIIQPIVAPVFKKIDMPKSEVSKTAASAGKPAGKPAGIGLPKTKAAAGGVVTSPTVALIGEDKPERIIPLKDDAAWIERLAAKINKGNGGDITAPVNIYLDDGTLIDHVILKLKRKARGANKSILEG
ncbi:MAG: hypothetical protein WCN92_12205, partial [Eubacteriales bacterium]